MKDAKPEIAVNPKCTKPLKPVCPEIGKERVVMKSKYFRVDSGLGSQETKPEDDNLKTEKLAQKESSEAAPKSPQIPSTKLLRINSDKSPQIDLKKSPTEDVVVFGEKINFDDDDDLFKPSVATLKPKKSNFDQIFDKDSDLTAKSPSAPKRSKNLPFKKVRSSSSAANSQTKISNFFAKK